MIILERPFASQFLIDTIHNHNIHVLDNEYARELNIRPELRLTNDQAIQRAEAGEPVYTNSENSVEWLFRHVPDSGLSRLAAVFKDKALLRDKTREMYPDYRYLRSNLADLPGIDFGSLRTPFIIKPSRGFMSLGVYTVNNLQEWHDAIKNLQDDHRKYTGVFPGEVLDTTEYLIEEYIDGDEYAIDVYFDREGNPVIINILKHIFTGRDDVSDRLYITSKSIILSMRETVMRFLEALGKTLDVRNFAMHIEARLSDKGFLPIEINPMRFAGWSTTDLAWYAYGINPILYFLEGRHPDWDAILRDRDDTKYSLIALDMPQGLDVDRVTAFDYDGFTSRVEKVLDLRPADFRKYPIFGFMFAETRSDNFAELESILHTDIGQFICY